MSDQICIRQVNVSDELIQKYFPTAIGKKDQSDVYGYLVTFDSPRERHPITIFTKTEAEAENNLQKYINDSDGTYHLRNDYSSLKTDYFVEDTFSQEVFDIASNCLNTDFLSKEMIENILAQLRQLLRELWNSKGDFQVLSEILIRSYWNEVSFRIRSS